MDYIFIKINGAGYQFFCIIPRPLRAGYKIKYDSVFEFFALFFHAKAGDEAIGCSKSHHFSMQIEGDIVYLIRIGE